MTFYRIAKSFPPGADEYRTKRQKDGDPPPHVGPAVARAYDGLSAFDSEQGARQQAKRIRVLGSKIVRFHIPRGSGITWEQTFRPGHYTLYGDLEMLGRYLDPDFVASVD